MLNSDLGTGIRMAAPLAMLSSLALCASKGILVKDGRALEMMNQVDTVLFDKTGTLTRERPEVGRDHHRRRLGPASEILGFAAAAERKFHHPIALAILHKADELGLALPPTDDTQYKVGYGITVQIEGHTVRVGSKRFMESEGHRASRAQIREALDERTSRRPHDGHGRPWTTSSAARSSCRRPSGPRSARSSRACASAASSTSRSSRATTRPRPESSPSRSGMDRYFAQVLPADKADYVAKLQAEGRQGLLRRRRDQRLDRPQEGRRLDLAPRRLVDRDRHGPDRLPRRRDCPKLCDLRDIARDLDRNVNRSWSMIVAPNITNIVGVFTMGFGIMTSVVTNNVSALAALANGLLPLRKITRAGPGRPAAVPKAHPRAGRRRRPAPSPRLGHRARAPVRGISAWRSEPVPAWRPGRSPIDGPGSPIGSVPAGGRGVGLDGPLEPSGGVVEVAAGPLAVGGEAVTPGAVERVEDPDQRRDLGALPPSVLVEHRRGGPLPEWESQSSDHGRETLPSRRHLGFRGVFAGRGGILKDSASRQTGRPGIAITRGPTRASATLGGTRRGTRT